MPRSGVISFVGRDEILKQLGEQLQTSERVAISTLTGMGGIGKTELALQYALKDTKKPLEMRQYQGAICWLNGRGESNIGIQLLRFIENYLQITMPDEGNLEERVAIGWQRWTEGESLIIFDDVEEIKQIEFYLPPQVPPPNKRFKVIITTRNQRISRNFAFLAVELLTLDDSIKLLASFIAENTINQDKSGAEALCKWLGYLPLGIELVGRYIRETDEDIATVFKSLKALKLDDESLAYPTDEIMTAKRGVAAAFELSWQRLSETAQTLAMSLSLFDIAPIPGQMFLQNEDNPKQTQKDLRDLKNLSLINDIGNKTYTIHPLIWQYFRAKLDESTEADSLKRHHCQLMAATARNFSETPTKADIEAFSPAIPHLALIAEELNLWLIDDDLIWPYFALGKFYQEQGLYWQAEPYYDGCLRITQTRFDEKSLYVLLSFNNLATLYIDQGKYKKAEAIFSQDLALTKIEEIEDPAASRIVNNIAELSKQLGRYTEAELLLLKGLELTKKSLGEEHPDIVIRLNNLGELYRCQGKYQKAESLLLQALDLTKKLFGLEHSSITDILNNLANLYLNQGRYEEGENFHHQGFELSKKLFGEEHPKTIISLNNLANLYQQQGKYKKAEELYLKSLNLSKKSLGDEHPDIAITLNNLALVYKKQGKYEEAEALYKKALQIRENQLGAEHQDVANSLNNLASLYETKKRFDEAELLYHKALEIKKKQLGTEHDLVANSFYNLAYLYRCQGKYAYAITNYQKAIEIYQRVLPDNHPTTEICINNYVTMLVEAPEGEVFPLISTEWQKIVLMLKKTFKINNNNSAIRK